MILLPPPLYGAATLLIMWLLHKYYPITSTQAAWPLTAGYSIIAIGLIIELISVLNFSRAGTTINPTHPERTTSLVTNGCYALSRKPMYLGMAIMLTGAALVFRSLTPLLMPLVFCFVVTFLQILPEEKILQESFGTQYESYKERVARWI